MKTGIVINSRLASSRIPQKALAMINGATMIEHLVSRLTCLNIPIIIAVPNQDYLQYLFLRKYEQTKVIGSIHEDDPLARMNQVAEEEDLDFIIRITHDKIFIDTELLRNCIRLHITDIEHKHFDYLYLNGSIPGTGFEIISRKALGEAAKRFKNVEFIGYAIKEVTGNITVVDVPRVLSGGIRLLIDYPNDLNLMHVLFSQLGNQCTLEQVISYLYFNLDIKEINKLPKVTIYTCAYNAQRFLQKAIFSVLSQTHTDFEYILIDDFSDDQTVEIMARAASRYSNVRFIRNESNIGLASSCNVALKEARGEYIIRLDADDYFCDEHSLNKLVSYSEINHLEITYPDYYSCGQSFPTGRHDGAEYHHAGGALFQRAALNYVKFTDGLRGHDSLDIWTRAKDFLKIGYLKQFIFCYTQRENSLSRQNLLYREQIKNQIQEADRAKTSSH